MSQSTISRVSQNGIPHRLPTHTALEDRLQGLSEEQLKQLHELVMCRLSERTVEKTNENFTSMEVLGLRQLTARESEVLILIASGYTRPEVAKALKITRNTAATHVANIYRKLDIESIAEATMLAFRWGIVS